MTPRELPGVCTVSYLVFLPIDSWIDTGGLGVDLGRFVMAINDYLRNNKNMFCVLPVVSHCYYVLCVRPSFRAPLVINDYLGKTIHD